MIEYSYNDTLGVITININNINIKKRGLFIITTFVVALSMITFTNQYCEARTKATNQTQIAGSNNVEKAWNFYISQGFSKEATAGILGNYMRESRMNPSIVERGNNIGFGIAQWSFARRINLVTWLNKNNYAASSLEGQLRYSIVEMQNMSFGKHNYSSFKRINNVKEATAVFEKYFERAGVVAIDERTKYAEEIYRKYA